MKMTTERALASAILTSLLVIQPIAALAKTADSKAEGTANKAETAAVSEEIPPSTQEAEKAPETPPTAQDILLGVCKDAGYGESCAKALLGMMWKESNNRAKVVGDRGKALGYFQIHYRMHKVSYACATDLKCSAEWSLKYMKRNGYPKYPSYAVQCHNGCNINNGYAASALRHGVRLWDKPLAISIALAK